MNTGNESTSLMEETPRGGTKATSLLDRPIEELCIDTIRTLAMDAVQQADSGHPGTPMALAPLAFVLWDRLLRYDPRAPDWFDRDRFVLSNGHACMLQYAVLHLTGYDISLDDLKRFRQWDSVTPGHPERHMTPGVEVTTGPLGQGLMDSVGMAMAEAHLAALFNRPDHEIVDHRTWAFCSDGDLMEGASHEAASLAGHLRLDRLTWVYDDNHITIEGDTALAYSDDVATRFAGYGWHVQNLGERANDLDALTKAFEAARDETARPSLIIVRSHIAWGAPHKQDTAAAHGSPLGADEVQATKRTYGWPEDETFLVPQRVRAHMGQAVARGHALHEHWDRRLAAWREAYPDLAARFDAALAGTLPSGWDAAIPTFTPDDGPMATRGASGKVLNAIAPRVPWLIGGSADLAGSNKTLVQGCRRFRPDGPRRSQPALGHPRARDGRGLIGHVRAWRRASVRRQLPDLHRLRAPRDPAGQPDGPAGDLRHDARFHRSGRGRAHAPAGRAPRVATRHAGPVRHPARGRERDNGSLARRTPADDRSDPPRAHAAEAARARPE